MRNQLAPGSARRERARTLSQASLPEKRNRAVSLTAIAALAAGAVFGGAGAAGAAELDLEALAAEAAAGTVVFERDFEDGEIAGGDGGVFDVVADPLRDGNLVQRAVTADIWHGLQIPADVFQAGATYRFEAQVLAPEGVAGMNARFEGASNPWPWVVGNQPLADGEWRTISGDFQWNDPEDPRDIDPMPVRLVNGGAGAFYMDDVRVTRIAEAPAEDEGAGAFEPYIAHTFTFADADDMRAVQGAGDITLARAEEASATDGWVLAGTNRGNQDWHSPDVTFPTTELAEYQLEVTVRLTDGAAGQLQPRIQPGHTYLGNQDITDEWTTVRSGRFVANGPETIRLNVVPAGASWEIDTINLWRVVPAPEVDEDFVFERLEFDFEDGDLGPWSSRHAADTLAIVSPGAAGSNYAMRISDRTDQGSGPLMDVRDVFRPGLRLEFTADMRFTQQLTDGNITLSIQNGPASFTNLVQNLQPGTEWTQVSGTFVVPAFTTVANLYFETAWAQGARGDVTPFEIDNLVIDFPEPLQWDRNLVPLSATLPGIHTGVAVDSRDLVDEFGDIIEHHFTHLVGENHMKPDAWWGNTGTGAAVNFWTAIENIQMHNEARAILDFAQDRDMTVFGHVLVWHSQIPAWFFSYEGSAQEMAPTRANQDEMIRRLEAYIRVVAQEIYELYGPFGSETNPFNSYEVANEVVAGNAAMGNANHNLRAASPWTRIFAPDPVDPWIAPGATEATRDRFLIEAFNFADHYMNYVFHVGDARWNADADVFNQHPDRISLWINDYNTERGTTAPDGWNYKRTQLLEITNRLIAAGAPIDGVGHQFHAGLIHPVDGLRHAMELFAYAEGRDNWVSRPVLQAVTEIDVTIPALTEANLIAQAHYYREAFDIIRSHHARFQDVDTVTMWGLNDGRSWRATQFPLLFNDDLSAKPAFAGAVTNAHILTGMELWDHWARPTIPGQVLTAYAFGAPEVTLDKAAWAALPPHRLTNAAGEFDVRWNPEAVYLRLDVPFGPRTAAGDALNPGTTPGINRGTQVNIELNGELVRLTVDGLMDDVDGVDLEIVENGASFTALVRIPGGFELADVVGLHVEVRNGADTPYIGGIQASGSVRGDWTSAEGPGLVTLVEDLSFAQVPMAGGFVDVNDFDAAVWSNAAVLNVDTVASGTNPATGEARALWYQAADANFGTLFVRVDVEDTTPDVSSPNAWEQDSVEFFLGLAERALDGLAIDLYDAQFRVSRTGEVTVRGAAMENARITSAAQDNGADGYSVIVALKLRTGTGHQVGQWTNFDGLGFVGSFDIAINDGVNGARAGITSWADPNAAGFTTTSRLGAIQLVDELPEAPAPTPDPEVELVSVEASASVERRNGPQNALTITVVETFSDGSVVECSRTFLIANNSDGEFQVGEHLVFVSTRGNTQVREITVR